MQQRCSWIRFATAALCAGALGVGACGDDASASLSGRSQDLSAVCLSGAGGAGSDLASLFAPKTLSFWAPNHKFHTVTVADCVQLPETCGGEVQAEFIWASSDEPIDARGDGHHQPDILVDGCDRVQVRSERQGGENGRVYKLGVRAVDASGNVAESACTILIDHDQRGVVASDSGESYRISFDGQGALPLCDGAGAPLPPAPDASVPPAPDASVPPAPDAATPPAPEPPGEQIIAI